MQTTLTIQEVQALQKTHYEAERLLRGMLVEVYEDGTPRVYFQVPHSVLAERMDKLRQALGEAERGC